MAQFYYLNDILQPLTHSLGEESIPSPVPTSRLNAVQYAINRVARLYDFDWSQHVYTQTLSGSVGTLDTTINPDGKMDVRQLVSGQMNDNVYQEVSLADFDMYQDGDYRYYISTEPTTGVATITITESITSLQITAEILAPVISAVVGVTFPDPKVLSDFALVNCRRYEDKDADTSVEEAIAMQGLEELIAIEQRNNPTGKAKNRYDKMNMYTGESSGDFSWAELNG